MCVCATSQVLGRRGKAPKCVPPPRVSPPPTKHAVVATMAEHKAAGQAPPRGPRPAMHAARGIRQAQV